MKKIYLDNNATTIVDPRVAEAVYEELLSSPSNPSSIHEYGRKARHKLIQARERMAAYFNCHPHEILFTSGATESLNMLLKGIKASHIISSSIEHASVYNTLKDLEKKKVNVTFLSPNPLGYIDPEQVKEHIREDTGLLIFSAANSETGVKNDLFALSHLALTYNIPLIIDGVALLGKEMFSIPQGVTAMVFSGHKFHAPQGIGLTFLRSTQKISPLITGGDQEYSKRGGTENLPGIIGLAKAIELLKEELPSASERMGILRDYFEDQLKKHRVLINGEGPRIPNTSNLSFPGIDGETLLIMLDREGIAASHGSACTAGALQPSRVLRHMNFTPERIGSSIRFSLSRFTTQEEINQALAIINKLVKDIQIN